MKFLTVKNENFMSDGPFAIRTNSHSNVFKADGLCNLHFSSAECFDSGFERSISQPGHGPCELKCEYVVGVIT